MRLLTICSGSLSAPGSGRNCGTVTCGEPERSRRPQVLQDVPEQFVGMHWAYGCHCSHAGLSGRQPL